MLSVCIPVYRYDVRPLVQELLTQAAGLAGPVELLVFDDASPEKTAWGQEELQHLPGINYFVFPKNLGRAAIRNKMA
ncbi:MAG: glycosyltransferase, partial [Bacteroidota bacterium]